MNRLNRILSAALAIQIVLAAVVFVPRLFPTAAASEPLFPGFNAQDVTRFAVQDDQGERVELAKKDGVWVYPDGGDYPADATAINAVLDKIAALKTSPLVTRTSASHKRLQVGDDSFLRKIDFALADGASYTLFVGSESGVGSAHVRAGGQDDVYLTSDLTRFDVTAKVSSWIDPVYVSVAQDKMVSLMIQNASGTLAFEKDADGNWTMKDLAAGETFNPDSLTTLLSRLSSLRMMYPAGKEAKPEYAIDDPNAVITVVAKDDSGNDQTYTIRVGAKYADDDSYAAIASTSTYYVRIAAFSIEDFVTKTRQDFLQLPPTPAATPEGAATPEPALEVTPALEATFPITSTAEGTPQPASTLEATPRVTATP